MKINSVYDICIMMQKENSCKGSSCVYCQLNKNNNGLKIEGELEIVKECDHDLIYTANHNDRISEISELCLNCLYSRTISLYDLPQEQLAKLFKEE